MKKLERSFGQIRSVEDDRTVEFVFSTNALDRHGTRINPEGWRLDNFNKNGIASYQHQAYGDPDPDKIIGPARAWVKDSRLMGNITFEDRETNPLADKLFKKVKAGTLNAVSVGFLEHDGHWGKKDLQEEEEVYYFDDVELYEISLVSIPSNPEALAVRNFEAMEDDEAWMEAIKAVTRRLEEFEKNKTDLTNEVINLNKMEKDEKNDLTPENERKVDVNVTVDASKIEEALGKFAEDLAERLPGPPAPAMSKQDEKDMEKYSFHKLIKDAYLMTKGQGQLTGVEKEMHQEAIKESREIGTIINGIGVPSRVLHAKTRADLAATITAAGGATVATDTIGFIDTLKNAMVAVKAGATVMSGLVGNVSIPKASANSTAYWRSEKGVATQSDPTFTSVTLNPNRLTAYTEYTNQLLIQSSIDVENFVRNNLVYSTANALETAAYEGSGSSNVPQGILNASVNDATHGSSNPTAASWANIVNMEQMVAVDNALAAKMAYIMKSTAAAKLKRTARDSVGGGYIWEGTLNVMAPVNGYPSYITNVFTNDTVLFGDWSQLIIAQFGGLDILVNPYTLDTYDTVRCIIAGYYDVAVKQANAFARINDLVVT